MEKKFARITLDPDFQISAIDKRVYGSFIEHLGRAVYGAFTSPAIPPPIISTSVRSSLFKGSNCGSPEVFAQRESISSPHQ